MTPTSGIVDTRVSVATLNLVSIDNLFRICSEQNRTQQCFYKITNGVYNNVFAIRFVIKSVVNDNKTVQSANFRT